MKNAGYTILKKELYSIKENLGIALGWNGKQAVTWCYQIDQNGEFNFFWGHYHTSYYSGVCEYHERLAKQYKEAIEMGAL